MNNFKYIIKKLQIYFIFAPPKITKLNYRESLPTSWFSKIHLASYERKFVPLSSRIFQNIFHDKITLDFSLSRWEIPRFEDLFVKLLSDDGAGKSFKFESSRQVAGKVESERVVDAVRERDWSVRLKFPTLHLP